MQKEIDFDNLQSEKSFDGLKIYSNTKIAMMCLMHEFALRNSNNSISLNICYPGQASTSMTQNVTANMLPIFMKPLFPLFKFLVKPDNGKTAKKASRSSVFLATSDEMKDKTGVYIDKNCAFKKAPNLVTNEQSRIFIWNYAHNLLKSNNIREFII